MNFFKFLFVATAMMPRDLKMAKDYLRLQSSIAWWRMRGYTIHQLFDQVAAANLEKTAIRLGDNAWTFQMLSDYSFQVANFFNEKGLQKGDVVALFMENKPRYVGLWLGLSRLGIITALINTGVKLESLSHAIKVADSKALIIDTELISVVQEMQGSKFKLPVSITLYTSGTLQREETALASSINLDPLLDESSTMPVDQSITKQLNLSSKMLYIFTSGTTGLPKAAIMTYNRFVFLATSIHIFLNINDKDILYTPMPLYHASGGLVGTGQTLIFGNTMILRQKFSARGYFPDCRKYGVTVGQYIGEMCSYLMAKAKDPSDTNHKVRLMFGNGMRPEIWTDFKNRFGVKQIGEFYGSTEGNANMVNSYNEPGSVGALPWFAGMLYPLELIAFNPETGEPERGEDGLCKSVPNGEPGILIGGIKQGSTTSSFSGYADEKATKKKMLSDVFEKGDLYFNSGDILKKNDYGFYYFVDRLGDTFRWKGENIATSQVELVISKNMEISPSDLTVYGVTIPDKEGRAGMVTFAVHCKPSENQLDLLALKNTVEKNLNDKAIPLFVRVTDDLPRTSTQKIKKVELQKQGFDMDAINADKDPLDADVLYFYSGPNKGYVPLTAQLYMMIVKGEIKF